MINFLQSNCDNINDNTFNIICTSFWEKLINSYFKVQKDEHEIKDFINESCLNYNIRIKNFIVRFITYLIENKEHILNETWLTQCQIIIRHIDIDNNKMLLNYFVKIFLDLYKL